MSKKYSIDNLKEIADGDEEFMAIIAKTFLEEIPPDLKAMEEAVVNNNRELAYQFAHKMKPNLEMFGLNLGKDISTLEAWTRSLKSQASVASSIENISTTLHAVFEELKEDFKV